MISIDGSEGEGGGQVLRTALALSMVTGKPFTMEKIRGKRAKPGLMRQHLACVKAAAEITGASHEGATVASTRLVFRPGPVRAGGYTFAIGTAGSTTLLLQTVLPALMLLDAPSSVTVTGGTHNAMAPSFDFIDEAFLPLVRRIGFDAHAVLIRRGFYPAGGGEIQVSTRPRLGTQVLALMDAGQRLRQEARAIVANLPYNIAEREAEAFRLALNWPLESCLGRTDADAEGYGNVVVASLVHEHVTEVFTGFGERGVSAERVAGDLATEVKQYIMADAPVGPHLADQLLLPMGLSRGGMFITSQLTAHFHTNARIIETFLPVEIETALLDGKRWSVAVRSATD
jgi:RNA 3'-terminal phosphate cyclase (ATP)